MKRRAVISSTAALLPLAGCVFTDGEVEYERGDLEVVVDDEPYDLSADRFQSEHADNDSIEFHLHERDDYWYMEGEEPVTFAAGLDHLPHFAYSHRDGDHVVTVDGTAHDGSDPRTELTFLSDGETVDPTRYEVRDGDSFRLEITTDG